MHVGLATGFAHQRGKGYNDARFVREEVSNLVLAEELGFDSVWITEHHFSDYSLSNDPLQLLTYIAAQTRHVKLGTQCIIVPWHNPARLAEKIVNLDILSNGRAILGFGGGLAQHEFAGLGIDINKSRALYTDILEVLIPALETGVIEGEGVVRQDPPQRAAPGADQELRRPQVLRLAVGQLDVHRGQARLRQHGADAAPARQGRAARQIQRGVAGSERAGLRVRRRRC